MNCARVSLLGQAVRLAIGLACGLAFALDASAQWLPDRAYTEGPGIRVGELELHPGIALRGGYDSNVFRSDGKEYPIQDSAVLAIAPYLHLSTETAQRAKEGEDRPAPTPRFIGFRGGISATYLHYFIDNGPRNLAIDTDFLLAIAQGRPVELDLTIGYIRSVVPFTESVAQLTTSASERRQAYVYNTVDPGLRLKFNSRSRVLTGHVGYTPRYTHYESSFFDYLNNIQHGIEAGAAWKFLPSTALIYDARLALQDYNDYLPEDRALVLMSSNQIFRTRLGVNGAITNSLALRLLAGYSAGFYDSGDLDEFEDGIGEATLTYSFGAHKWDLGYQRDVQTSPLGAWYRTDRAFTKLYFLFARRVALGFEAAAGKATYGRLVRIGADGDVVGMGVGGDTSRDDIRIDGAVRGEYRVTNWFAFMADVTVQSIITDFDYELSAVEGQVIADPADYNNVQAFGGVRFHY